VPCQQCVQALEDAGRALQELMYYDSELLPPDRDWQAVSLELLELAGRLRRNTTPPTP
jgi:hypothetical protein